MFVLGCVDDGLRQNRDARDAVVDQFCCLLCRRFVHPSQRHDDENGQWIGRAWTASRRGAGRHYEQPPQATSGCTRASAPPLLPCCCCSLRLTLVAVCCDSLLLSSALSPRWHRPWCRESHCQFARATMGGRHAATRSGARWHSPCCTPRLLLPRPALPHPPPVLTLYPRVCACLLAVLVVCLVGV